MTKIPVLETIRAAYRFTFTHLGAIIGLIWLPMILATVIGFFVLQRFFSALADAFASNNLALAGPAMLGLISFLLVALLLLAMMAVPVIAVGAGQPQNRRLGAFRLRPGGMAAVPRFAGRGGFSFRVASDREHRDGRRARAPRAMSANIVSLLVFYAAVIFFGLRFGFLLPVGGGGRDGAGAAQKLDTLQREFLAHPGGVPGGRAAGPALDGGSGGCAGGPEHPDAANS